MNVQFFVASAADRAVWTGDYRFLTEALRKAYTSAKTVDELNVCLLYAENLPLHIAGRVIAAIQTRINSLSTNR